MLLTESSGNGVDDVNGVIPLVESQILVPVVELSPDPESDPDPDPLWHRHNAEILVPVVELAEGVRNWNNMSITAPTVVSVCVFAE